MEKSQNKKLRSWGLLLFGLGGITYQQWTGETNGLLLLIYTSMIGVPGLTDVLSLLENSPTVMRSSLSRRSERVSDSDNSLDTTDSRDDKKG